MHRSTQDEITTFIKDSDFSPDQGSRIPAGLVVAGPAIASHAQFFDSLAERVSNETESVFVSLKSTECPNLKTLLKNVIRKATAAEEDDGDEHVVTRRKGPKLLNYDLQLLYEWCQDQQPKHVVVTFQDSEAFDGPLLADTIQLMRYVLSLLLEVLLISVVLGWIASHSCFFSASARQQKASKKSFPAPRYAVCVAKNSM